MIVYFAHKIRCGTHLILIAIALQQAIAGFRHFLGAILGIFGQAGGRNFGSVSADQRLKAQGSYASSRNCSNYQNSVGFSVAVLLWG